MSNLCELNRYQIYREVKLHSSLQHENIITLFAAFKEGDQVRRSPSHAANRRASNLSLPCSSFLPSRPPCAVKPTPVVPAL
eukprot:363466-Chlamydomonas_euryale.AAC.8